MLAVEEYETQTQSLFLFGHKILGRRSKKGLPTAERIFERRLHTAEWRHSVVVLCVHTRVVLSPLQLQKKGFALSVSVWTLEESSSSLRVTGENEFPFFC